MLLFYSQYLILTTWVSKNRVLKRIFGTKMEEVAGGWRRLHNEGHQILLGRSNQGGWDGMGGAACMGEMRNKYNILVGKPEEKRPLGRSKHRWEDNITMNLRETGWEDADWIHLAQDRDWW
jgi:hypothetical protein